MTGKAKPKKHTAKEISSKIDAATTNRGGGKAGQADRSGQDKGGHAKLECPLCRITAPDIKSMQIHHDARHPKIPFDESKLVNLHGNVIVESSKPRPGVRGSFKKYPEVIPCPEEGNRPITATLTSPGSDTWFHRRHLDKFKKRT